ncbi:glycoside hydrolase family 71 protein [Hypholoma sublateritium FD-334 SS-4]|uniref:Glycoside hydrolase family 71 protein n=1 Tax=Hypholoma sublateritium (strain FD-334 SS-4) TaxID=945553 RepID=A0A0D2MXH0_HYPSF|nr:glycoside hydrolase family 71 protein [Hypholoma sublateritium FD-334 SS-4]
MPEPTQSLPPGSLEPQRALEHIRPSGIQETQGFGWNKEPESGSRVEFELEEVAERAVSTRKHVFAHFIVGNTYPYTVADWVADIKLAASQDIDGFVLNVGGDSWQKQRSADCFAAAKKLSTTTKFSLFFSFDMTSIPGSAATDVQFLRDYITPNYNSGVMFRQPATNHIVVSTFGGEYSTFGQGSMESGWAYLKSELNKITPIFLIPAFFISPSRLPSIAAIDGAFNWDGGWPIKLSASSPRNEIVNAALDSDTDYIRALTHGARSYMAAVSPWFFTHYGPNTYNKNWMYRGDDWLFVRRWQQLIAMRDHVDMVQIISWNDYGESHYIGPIEGAQPNSHAWVDGYPHIAWLYLNRYFMKAFQTGTYPAITKDQIFLWARPHPRDASSPDPVPRPTNYQLTDDVAWMVVFATAAATVDAYTTNTNKVSFAVKAGMSKLSFPLLADGGMKAVMVRNGAVVAECNPTTYRFESRPGVYNFNTLVAMSS